MRPKAKGYSDIEFAILRELGHDTVPVATTVHQLSIVDDFPRDDIDLPLSFVITPDETIEIVAPFPAPDGINWDLLNDQDLKEMPVLMDLKLLGAKKQKARSTNI